MRQQLRQLLTGESPWPLFLHGPAGTGKTCAALCLLDHVGGHYWTVADWSDALIQAQHGGYMLPWDNLPCSPWRLWRCVERAALVVLDELGTRDRVSDFQFESLKRVLDLREGLPLVCVSNLHLGQLARVYDDRLASRLGAGTVLGLDGADRRLERVSR